jgi:hypothetical protein
MDKIDNVQIGKNKTDWQIIIIASIAFGLVVVLWFLTWLCIEPIKDPVMRGTIGDMFNANNSLFSGLAFAGIIVTIILQKRELKLQREELMLTRKELARTAEAQERQTENFKISAELSALNTMVNFLTDEKSERGPARHSDDVVKKRHGYLNRIEEILQHMEHKDGQMLS